MTTCHSPHTLRLLTLLVLTAALNSFAAPTNTNLVEALKAAKTAIDDNCRGATANYNNDGYDRAIARIEEALKDETLTAAERISTMKTLAYAYLDRAQDVNKADIEKGHQILEDAIKLPNLTDNDRAVARLNLADLLWSEFRRDEAVAIYQDLLKAEKPVNKSHLENRLVEQTRDTKGEEAALTLYRDTFNHVSNDRDMKNYYLRNKKPDEALKLILKEIAIAPTNATADRLRGPANDLFAAVQPHDVKTLKAKFEPPFAQLATINPGVRERFFAEPRLMRDLPNRAAKEWWVDNYIASVTNSLSAFETLRLAREIQLSPDRLEKIAKIGITFAETAPDNQRARLKRDDLAAARLVPLLARETGFRKAAASVDRMITEHFPTAKTNALDKAEIYKLAARLEYEFGREDLAREFLARRESMHAKREQAVYAIRFIKEMPNDLGSLLASDTFKKIPRAVLKHKYGENLQFLLETDAAIKDRVIGEASGITAPTEFTAWVDTTGLKIVLRSFERNTADIRAGFAQSVGYEIYFAPSLEAPYHCFFNHAASDGGLNCGFYTQYTGPNNHVQLTPKRMRTDWKVLDDGVAMLIAIPWNVFYGFVPKNGDQWHFEPIHWVNGGMTWGGSESVHNRSSWGVLKFEGLSPQDRTAIKRAILPAAAANYRRALSARDCGCIDHWMDNILGDRDFYLQAIKPLIESRNWNADVACVKNDMSDEDVNRIFDAHAVDWMNIQEIVSRLRTAYLTTALTQE